MSEISSQALNAEYIPFMGNVAADHQGEALSPSIQNTTTLGIQKFLEI